MKNVDTSFRLIFDNGGGLAMYLSYDETSDTYKFAHHYDNMTQAATDLKIFLNAPSELESYDGNEIDIMGNGDYDGDDVRNGGLIVYTNSIPDCNSEYSWANIEVFAESYAG